MNGLVIIKSLSLPILDNNRQINLGVRTTTLPKWSAPIIMGNMPPFGHCSAYLDYNDELAKSGGGRGHRVVQSGKGSEETTTLN